MEANIQHATNLLIKLYTRFQEHGPASARAWLTEIAGLKNYSTKTRTIVGIIGATGAGKSALINALLGEERILPTNCMRACTAVVTEISHNASEVPYRAEIEFIEKDQWRSELKILLGDLLGDHGRISGEISNESTEAGLAYAKLKAVYSNLSRDNLAHASIEELMSHSMTEMLGQVIPIEEFESGNFYKRLRVYIDSGEKIDLRLKGTKIPQILEYWPIIKVVRVFLRSSILQNGLVLVDLPGVHDSNAARAAVSQNYLKECSRLFVVAPINRAVDDKSAKSLMGDSFKRQMKLDGTVNSITFICSKTDGINEEEVKEDMNLVDTIQPYTEKKDRLEAALMERSDEYESIQYELDETNKELQEADIEREKYIPLLMKARAGKVVMAPIFSHPQCKRKRPTAQTSSRKKPNVKNFLSPDSDDGDSENDDSEVEELTCDQANQSKEMTLEEVEQKAVELQQRKHDARSKITLLKQRSKALEHESKLSKREFTTIREQISRICISARNEYSRAAIKRDFAAGIEEFDAELAAGIDLDKSKPTEKPRDYKEVANSLPVFCVSSLAFQRLEGRLKKERKTWGFQSASDTEIPQLQEHARQIAEVSRVTALKGFLSEVDILCTSLKIWAVDQTETPALAEERMTLLRNALQGELDNLKTALLSINEEVTTAIASAIETNVRSNFKTAISRAQAKAFTTVSLWGRPVDRDIRANSGLHCLTYQATTRRNGYFQRKDAVYDFNRDLSEPLVNYLTPGWEKVFIRLVPPIFREALRKSEETIAAFQTSASATGIEHGASIIQLQLLERHAQAHTNKLRDALRTAKSKITKRHKDINRKFVPTIQQAMSSTYANCAALHGDGMFKRLKLAMEEGVSVSRETMFETCTDLIGDQLSEMVRTVDQMLQQNAEDVTRRIGRGYLQLASLKNQEKLAAEKGLMDDVLALVNNYESYLKKGGKGEAADDTKATEIEAKAGIYVGKSASTNGPVPCEGSIEGSVITDNNSRLLNLIASTSPPPQEAHDG